jgi:probable F420-dependent oxidoreductase
MSAAALAEAAPGRFQLGIGSSSPVVVGAWNSVEFTEPYERSRDMLRFLKAALGRRAGRPRLRHVRGPPVPPRAPPATPPQVLLAALRPGMLRLAAAEADGVILNWLSPPTSAPRWPRRRRHRAASRWPPASSCAPTDDAGYARTVARRLIAAYLTVPAYAAFHRWLGRDRTLTPMWEALAAGERKAALAAIPDEVVDDLIVHGNPETCRAKVEAYAKAGVTVPVMALLPTPALEAGGPTVLLETLTALGR